MAEFTPGPWTADEAVPEDLWFEEGNEDETARGWWLKGPRFLSDGEGYYFTEADARLIAAAPDLYAEVERLIDAISAGYHDGQYADDCPSCRSVVSARSTLAKARGVPQ